MSEGREKCVDREGRIFYSVFRSAQVSDCMTMLEGGGTMKTTKCSSVPFSGLLPALSLPGPFGPPYRLFPVSEPSGPRCRPHDMRPPFPGDEEGLGNLIDTLFGISSNVVNPVLEVN